VITDADIAHWRSHVPWVDADQVEQDLVMSRVIVEIANDPVLGPELVFRGGTCFHKLWLDRPWRYSEDLDYVRSTAGGVGDILTALRSIGERVGFERVNTAVGKHPKTRFRSTFATGGAMTIKIEINTFERSPARPTVQRSYGVDSPWFTGDAAVPTFDLAELIATKIRALFQRKKGRDLFDLWLAVRHAGVAPERHRCVLRAVPPRRVEFQPRTRQPERQARRRAVRARPRRPDRGAARGLHDRRR
jgi:predicted nucleotidyltransferase component of viral defense system